MHSLRLTTVVISTAILSVLAAPPLRRDEWQPADPNQDPPQGAPVVTISSTVTVTTTTDLETATSTSFDPFPSHTEQACVYFTNGIDWSGEGLNLCQQSGQCAPNLPDGLSGQVLSAGPSQFQYCMLYSEEACRGDESGWIQFPGFADLSIIGFANRTKSWQCRIWDNVIFGQPPDATTSSPEGLLGGIVTGSDEESTAMTSLEEQQTTTPGGLPVSTISFPGVQTTPTTVPVQTTTPGGLPVSTVSFTEEQATSTIPTVSTTTIDSAIEPTNSLSSVPEDSPAGTDITTDPSVEPTTDDVSPDTASPTTDDSSTDQGTGAPSATFVATTVTHTYADGETVVTTL